MPFRVVNFPNKSSYEQLPDLFIYGCVSLWIKLSALLNDWFMLGIHIEPVDYDRGADSRHILHGSAFLFLFPFPRIKFSQCMGDSVRFGWGFHVF